MSNFNSTNTTFNFNTPVNNTPFQSAQTFNPSGENQHPRQWVFPQATVDSRNFGSISMQVHHQVPPTSKAHRKRSSSGDEQEDQRQHAPTSSYANQAPTKRRRGLADKTISTVNSAPASSFWGTQG